MQYNKTELNPKRIYKSLSIPQIWINVNKT